MGSTGLKKQLATQPGNCYSSGNTLLDRYVDGHSDKIFDAYVLAEAIKAVAAFVAVHVVFLLQEDLKERNTMSVQS